MEVPGPVTGDHIPSRENRAGISATEKRRCGEREELSMTCKLWPVPKDV